MGGATGLFTLCAGALAFNCATPEWRLDASPVFLLIVLEIPLDSGANLPFDFNASAALRFRPRPPISFALTARAGGQTIRCHQHHRQSPCNYSWKHLLRRRCPSLDRVWSPQFAPEMLPSRR